MQAGWYALGPKPGEIGAAVIVGHVDGDHSEGIFFQLHEVQPGDEILVNRRDSATARFVVDHVERVPKSDFPTERVYGSTGRPELRVITCGGPFDPEARSYRDNVIVYAVLAN